MTRDQRSNAIKKSQEAEVAVFVLKRMLEKHNFVGDMPDAVVKVGQAMELLSVVSDRLFNVIPTDRPTAVASEDEK